MAFLVQVDTVLKMDITNMMSSTGFYRLVLKPQDEHLHCCHLVFKTNVKGRALLWNWLLIDSIHNYRHLLALR